MKPRVAVTHVWAPGGRYMKLADWKWAWSFNYYDEQWNLQSRSSTRLYDDRGECQRDMARAIAEVEEGLLTDATRHDIMSEGGKS